MHKELLEDIGEKELIKRLAEFMPENQVSDDCAFVKTKNTNLLINTDSLVENIHFNNDTISAIDIGWKAVACNVSDLISSGCNKIIGITIGLVVPSNTDWIWIKDLYTGINLALDHFGGLILGGDCSVGKEKVISVTALGTQGELKLRRNSCKPKEIILTTGIHGLSKLGLMIKNKTNFDKNISLTKSLVNSSLQQFRKPKLKTEFLKKVLKARPNKSIDTIGCTDSSDGLFQALLDLATESNCKAIIDYKKIPKHKNWPKGDKWDEYYFFGGEDYELVFSLPRKWADNLLCTDKTITEIGYFINGDAAIDFKNCNNKNLFTNKSFSHF
ncbi:putative thiamine-monophosphate kinase [Prochlorococcus marinus str. MIT 9515]|uniref:Thiamine-monophosphate kinase n=1 Tax=Prochlorococcus marinus (strain MIT 9515) TaxID=167542 RepID=A2BTX1_PROM5|nr:thiamine-phosphate kinase [Prochlorococcus marinus]ABM71232.1 putative thiamine-monophosphate kinase [Prochlorococcus marinus str. MIT 9515]